MEIKERNDVRWALVVGQTEYDGGVGYLVGSDGVTEMRVVKRHGPMDWIPYIEVYRGEQLYAEIPQHSTLYVEFIGQADAVETPPPFVTPDPNHEPGNPRCICTDCIPF